MRTISSSHGHRGLVGSPMTSSTMVRAISGTIAWPALPRTAAVSEIWTSRLCFQTWAPSLRIHPGVGSWLAGIWWRRTSLVAARAGRRESSSAFHHPSSGWLRRSLCEQFQTTTPFAPWPPSVEPVETTPSAPRPPSVEPVEITWPPSVEPVETTWPPSVEPVETTPSAPRPPSVERVEITRPPSVEPVETTWPPSVEPVETTPSAPRPPSVEPVETTVRSAVAFVVVWLVAVVKDERGGGGCHRLSYLSPLAFVSPLLEVLRVVTVAREDISLKTIFCGYLA